MQLSPAAQTLRVRGGLGRSGRLGRRWAWALAAAALAAVIASSLFAAQESAGPQASALTHSGRGLVSLPAAARGVIARSLGGADRRYFVRVIAAGFALTDARAGINGSFTRASVVVHGAGLAWSLGLRAIGRGNDLARLAPVSPIARANQVRFRRGGLEEWYMGSPLGLEQGFTLRARPSGTSGLPLKLVLGNVPANVRVSLSRDRRSAMLSRGGRVLLRYSGLFASDARGRSLPAWIEGSGSRLSLHVDDRAARYPLRVDPFVQAGKLTASDGATSDNLGLSVAVSGDTIVAGAPLATVSGTHFEGAAYVFVRSAGGWASATQVAKLTPSDGANDSEFGSGVGISGDTIAVGAPEIGGGIANGAVYVFVKPVAGWGDATETAKLTASDGHDQDGLGAPLAMTADTIAAANGRGAVYVFTKPAGGWANSVQTAKLTNSDSAAVGSVAIDAGTIAAGAPNVTVGGHFTQGAVYVYTEPNTGWVDATQTAKVTASDGAANDNLGASVGVSGGVVAAGARYAATPSTRQGAVYVFVKPAGGWANGGESAKLTASDGAANDTLGASVAISGDTIVAGAPQPSPSSGNGEVYVFTRPAGGWQNGNQSDKLTASDGASGDQLGSAVAITPGIVLAGAPHATLGGHQGQGAAYVYGSAGGTSTAVSCAPASVTTGSATACTATVSDAVAGGSDPTGSVTFSTDSSGSFESGGVCMLSSTQTAGVAACSVHYLPSAVGTGTHTITAGYGGDGSHASSGGRAQVTITSIASGGGNGGSGGSGTGGGGTGGGGNGVVVARFGLVGRAQTLAHSLLLNGGSSSTTSGGIADYTWIVGAPGQPPVVDPCGSSPLVAMNFQKAGIHDVTLRVITTSGQTSSTTQQLNVPAVATNQWFDASYDCENPGSGNVPNRGDCVKTFGWGVVQVNSRGNASDCFQLQQRDALRQPNPTSDRAGTATASPNLAHLWATHATINGPVAIDGLYMPVPESVQSGFDDWNSTIQIGRPIPIAVGPYHLASIVLNAVVGDPDPQTGLVPLKAAVGLSGSNNQLGGLPLGGLVDVNLSSDRSPDGFYISKVKLHIGFPSPLPPVDAYLQSDNENGAHLTGFQVGPIDKLPLGFGLTLTNAFFTYMGGTDNVWTGGANIYLPLASTGLPQPGVPNLGPGIQFAPPPADLGIGFRNGQLDHFGIGVVFPTAVEPPLFLGVGLRDVHVAIGLQPNLRFTGGLGVDVGQVIGIDGDVFVAFPSASSPYYFPSNAVPGGNGDLAPLAGRKLDSFTFAVGADAHFLLPFLDKITLLNAWVIYESPDYFEIGSSFDFDDFLELKGNGGGWIEPSQGKFNIGGSLSLCLNHVKILGVSIHPCISDGVVVSSRGVGGCATLIVPVPVLLGTVPVPVTLTAGYTSDGGFQVTPFDCNLDPFTEANPRGASDHAAGDGRMAAAMSWSFRVPRRAPSAEVRITGQAGAPDVTLRGPGGLTYSTTAPPSIMRKVMMFQYGDTTLIALNHPARGTWTVVPNPGSTSVVTVVYAIGQPPPRIKAHLLGRGRTRTLAYTDTPARGRVITFVERGARTYHILGVAHGRRGRIRFDLADGRAGRREIVAQVEDNGIQTQAVTVARYTAPGPQRPGRPAHVRVTHRGFALNVSWKPVPGAVAYEVLVEAVDGGREMTVVRGHRANITDIEPGLRGKVLVSAVTAGGVHGAEAAHAFARAPIPKPKRPKLKPPKPTRHHH